MSSQSNNSYIEDEFYDLEVENIENEFLPISTIRDYQSIETDYKKLEIKYLNNDLAKKYIKPFQFTALKMRVYNCKENKFSELTTFLENFLQSQNVEELHLNFSDYNGMTDKELQSLSNTFQKFKGKLNILHLNLNNWGEGNEKISHLGCQYLGQLLKSQENLEVCSLLCSKWGLNNSKINDEAIQNLMSGIANLLKLKHLEMDLQTWGCQKFSSLGHITDKGLESLAKSLYNLKKMEQLHLNLRSWGYQNKKVTNTSLRHLGEALNQMNALSKLHLNLYCWGYENDQISGEGIEYVMNQLNNHPYLEDINVNFDGWGLDQKQKRNLVNISNDTVQGMFDHLQKYERLKNFSINLNQWGWKNNTISNSSLGRIGTFLQHRGQNLQNLELGLKMWYNTVDKINQSGIDNLSNGLTNCKNLKKLLLNLECMGFKNRNIDNNCIKQIASPLEEMQDLEELHLLLECWGVEDQQNLGIVCDQDIENIMKPIERMNKLKILKLNFNSWGYKNNRITDKSIEIITNCLKRIGPQIINLELHLKNWGYYNREIQDNSLIMLTEALSSLKNIQSLKLDIENWGEGNTKIHLPEFQKLVKQMQQLTYITNLDFIHNLQDWDMDKKAIPENDISFNLRMVNHQLKLLDQKRNFNKNLIIANETVQQYYAHVFRKEMIYDIVENLLI